MKNILIIDDDPGIRDLLRIIFKRAGYSVTVESNGEFIFRNDYICPDIFLLDRYISGIDGLDICKYLKKDIRSCNIPVIMISASPDIATLAMEAGADEFIEKPFDISELIAKVSRYCMAENE
jgi:DNA-binding response OmpR family regulator